MPLPLVSDLGSGIGALSDLRTFPDVAVDVNASTSPETGTPEPLKGSGMRIIFQDLRYVIDVVDEEAKAKAKAKAGKTFFGKTVLKEKNILRNVSGTFMEGRMTAVMGASGAGKTSLLQLLAGECRNGRVSGSLMVNNEKFTNAARMKKISGFVFQDDMILSTMTVREALTMSATLRLPKTATVAERNERITSTIKLLNLTKCADTIVGDSNVKGISGGERKRTAIAMELITNPSMIFLDEPTSGLDSFTAYSVVNLLRGLALSGRTVIATIHQPSSEIFYLFDDLLLLAEGRVIYHGEVKNAIDYFGGLGFKCPQYVNPSDFIFMSILNNEEGNNSDPYHARQKNETNKDRINRLLDVWTIQESQQKAVLSKNESLDATAIKQMSGFWTQFTYLFSRASKNAFRNPLIVRAKFGQTLFISLLIGWLYVNTDSKTGFVAVQNRTGVLFFLAINNVFSSAIGVLSIFGQEKLVFAREFGAGYYTLQSYFASKILVELPFYVIFPWMNCTIVYWMTGLQPLAGKYFIACAAVILCALCGFMMGIFFASIFSSLPIALAVTPLVLLPLMLFSGLFVNQGAIPVSLDWVKYLSPMKYGFEALALNEFSDAVLIDENGKSYKGELAIKNLGFENDGLSVGLCCGILLVFVIVLMALAYFGLYRVVRSKMNSSSSIIGEAPVVGKGSPNGSAHVIEMKAVCV